MRIKAVSPMPLLPQGLHVRPRILKYGKETTVFFFLLPGKNSNQTLREKKKTYNINKKTRGKTIYKETQEILSSLSRLFQKLLKAVTHKNKRD
jgi:hypothetical protein